MLGSSLPIEEDGDKAPRDSAFDASVVIHEYFHGVAYDCPFALISHNIDKILQEPSRWRSEQLPRNVHL